MSLWGFNILCLAVAACIFAITLEPRKTGAALHIFMEALENGPALVDEEAE